MPGAEWDAEGNVVLALARRHASTVGQACVAILLIAAVTWAPAAHGSPADLNAVREKVMNLHAQAEAANERYNEANGRLQDAERRLQVLQEKVSRQRKRLGRILGSVDDLARTTYASGGVDPTLQILLAEDPAEFLAQASALDQVAHAQQAALRRTQTARLQLAQAEAELEQKKQLAAQVRKEMRQARDEANARLREAQAVLAGLAASERARLAKLAASERRAALQAAQAAQRALQQTAPSSSGGGYSGGSRAAKAVQYALAQVGDRYVAARSGPDSFDCSGLTMAAWRQAGISLPHYSYSQYSHARKIPLSQAQPGDLVFFFGGSVHHVGMYIGNGKMVHAANPGDGVIISSVLGPWYRTYFTGVGRVL